jgi:hypothetical protein
LPFLKRLTLWLHNNGQGYLGEELGRRGTSVQSSPAIWSPTQARNLLILDGELVVVSDLLTHGNISLRVDDNLLPHAEVDYLGIAVWLKRVGKTYNYHVKAVLI